jgi:hypothetical protein
VAVVKTRGGGHEDSIREFRITGGGIELGDPLTDFRGVLSGLPEFTGSGPLLREAGGGDGGGDGDGDDPRGAATGTAGTEHRGDRDA